MPEPETDLADYARALAAYHGLDRESLATQAPLFIAEHGKTVALCLKIMLEIWTLPGITIH